MLFKEILKNYGQLILNGVGVTLFLAILGTLFGLVIALFLGSVLSLKDSLFDTKFQKYFKKVGKAIINVYVTVFRGTPMVVQAMIFFYSFYKMGITCSYNMAGLFTVTLNTGLFNRSCSRWYCLYY